MYIKRWLQSTWYFSMIYLQRHAIARPCGRAMECSLWVHWYIYIYIYEISCSNKTCCKEVQFIIPPIYMNGIVLHFMLLWLYHSSKWIYVNNLPMSRASIEIAFSAVVRYCGIWDYCIVGYRNWYQYWGHCCLINDLGSSPQPGVSISILSWWD